MVDRKYYVPSYGLYIPNFGKASDVQTLAQLAGEAEEAGWDGFFLWNHLIDEKNRPILVTDPFVALAAIGMSTKRIRIGTTVTPLPRYRPWIVAREMASLDRMTNGRMVLGVGLGFTTGEEYEMFGEPSDLKIRGEKLDEELEIITGLWSGKPFTYNGKYYQVKQTAFKPTPTQKPRIPIWLGGFWPHRRPFRRAAKWDGVIPLKLPVTQPKPRDIRDISMYIESQRSAQSKFDVAVVGWGTGRNRMRDEKKIRPYIDAGITWWLESLYGARDSAKDMRSRIRKGPPRVKATTTT